MNAHDCLLSALAREFRTQAQPRLRSLWADLMELEEAADGPAFWAAREQILHRILALGRAARAAHVHEVPGHGEALARLLLAVGRASDAASADAFAALYQEMTGFTRALCGGRVDAVTGSHAEKSAEGMDLVGWGTN